MLDRLPFTIGFTDIPAGTRKTVDLPVSVLSDHTPVSMSVHVVNGKKAGPVLFVSAAIHGDEVVGVEIARRLLRSNHLKSIRGTLLVIPIVNTFGFLNRSRYLPDRRDLNRCFPGSKSGSLASRLAHLFLKEVVTRCDYGIDIHSAAIHRTNLPQIRCGHDDSRLIDLAYVFGAPAIVRSHLRDGSLRGEAQMVGTKVLLFESGEGLRFDEISVRSGVAGILRVMQHLEMLPPKRVSKPKTTPLDCSASKWLRAPAGGLLRMYRSEGDVVRAGDLLATVSDPFGESDAEICAPFDGVIIGRAVMPVVNEGDAICHLAQVSSNKKAEVAIGDITAQLEVDPLFDEDEII